MLFRPTLLERLLHRFRLLPVPVLDAFASVLFGRALVIGVRTGLFEALRDHALPATDIARRTALHPESVSILAEAFVEGGYLKRAGDAYALAAHGRKWLLRDSPHSLVRLVEYFEMLHERWGSLERTLRDGGPSSPYYAGFGSHDWETYLMGMRELARFLLPAVMKSIAIPQSAKRLLDVGGSHGLYALECCRRSEHLTATVIDFEEPLRWTTQFVRDAGLEGRVATMAGDFLTLDLPKKQDIILLCNVIHGLSDAQNRELVGRLLNVLEPGGKLYILDQMRTTKGRSHLARFIPLMVGLNLLHEIGGKAYAVDDIQRWCGGDNKVRQLPLGIPGVTLVAVLK